ncbi:MAG: flagellar biosynthetic protein FliR [Pseudomonadales bacterium]|nr:flagellar biosynthetic protein FliR [Pseudomonadales bacterium]NRA18047.1 flagellar biosynthetic protein FliR [Oceanospirillaceae bacterium]
MFDLSFLQIEQMVGDFFLPFFRIAAFMMSMPLISTQYVPKTIRLILAIAFSVAIVPTLPAVPLLDGLSLSTYLLVAEQMLIGVAIGFSLHIMFQIFAIGGQMIANQMGLGFASVNDPANGVSIVVVGQYYMMLSMMLFVTMNGHLIMFQTLAESFTVLPVGVSALDNIQFWQIVNSATWMFQAAVVMALPAVTALLIVNVSFGVMSKAAPQLNIIAVGFPFTMTLGIFITWMTFSGFLGQFEKISSHALAFAGQILIAK